MQLCCAEFRIEGHAGFPACPFGFRAVFRPVPEVGEALLHVQRNRVINLGADAAFRKVGAQPVPIRDADHILVVDVALPRTGGRRDHPSGRAERFVIISRIPPPARMPFSGAGT